MDLFGGAGPAGVGLRAGRLSHRSRGRDRRHAAQTYRLNHPGVPVRGVRRGRQPEMRSVVAAGHDRVPSAVIAGPPCQGYSAAGARTIGDRRNLLFRHVSRLARELRARSVLIENVPGVRRVNGVAGYLHGVDRLRLCSMRAMRPAAEDAIDEAIERVGGGDRGDGGAVRRSAWVHVSCCRGGQPTLALGVAGRADPSRAGVLGGRPVGGLLALDQPRRLATDRSVSSSLMGVSS